MTEGNTELNPLGTLVIPNGFIIGEASGGGDCFFDSVAQGMNALCISSGPFDVKVLRQACFNYADCNQGSIYDSRNHKTWRQAIEDDAVAGKYATNSSQQKNCFYIYMANIGLTAAENSHLGAAIWGRPEIEGRMLCEVYGIKLHIIENFHSSGQKVMGHQLVDSSGSRSVDEHSSLYNDPQIIHILNEGLCHFTPILRKTSVPNKPIEKEVSTSPSDGMQSQNSPTYGLKLHPVQSVAASQQEVSLLLAQSERRRQTPVKIGSVSEMNIHQSVGSRYLKEFSLTDKSTWSAVAAKKEDADFKVLKIRNSPTVSAALDFMLQAEFYETFNQASHWFFIVIEVANCSEFPSKALEYFAKVLDEKKPLIIQWDFMDSAEHLVFFKQTVQSALTPLQMNSASLFSTEEELIDELSKEGSFQLPLLLNALQLGIGGQLNGGALDLLNVNLNVKQEINTRRLIDYAARDDDSLSLRFLHLVDWDLAHKNGDGRRTLEIAAEYSGPQSLCALLNLPIISSTEEYFLSNKEKDLLALRDDYGDNPLLIAADKGRPETLKFLICCGTDILCLRQGSRKLTAINLAWNKEHYENVLVLLEADSPFPDVFDLSGKERVEKIAALMKQVENRRSFQKNIKDGSQTHVKAFIKIHPRLKWAYDPSNQSALMTALKARQYEIYAMLLSEGLRAGKNEELSVVIEELTIEERDRLRQAKIKYFGKQDDSHIIYLLSKSRVGIGQENENNFGIIRELYKQLDAIPEITTILKVVECSAVTEIIYDFDNDSIVDLDPTDSSGTKGSCYYREGLIYIGAKEQSLLLGTLAHELTHLAMQVCYDNECNPYEALDEQKMCAFSKIVAQYRKRKGIDEIIKRVFDAYENESDWPSELIVRVPHILAHYKGERGKQLLKQQVPELLSFYEQHTQEDLKKLIENPAHIKARHQIQHLNTLLGKMDEIEQSKIWLNEECLLNDDVINYQHIWILSSPLPLLTILNLYQVLKRKRVSLSDIKSDYIFVSAEQFKNQEKADAICDAFQSVTHPTLIIDCSHQYDTSETDLWSTLNNFSERRRIIFIAVTDVAQSLQDMLQKNQAKMMPDREYTWSDLTTDSRNEFLKNTVCFQGSPVSLNELISDESPVTKFLPLADLLGKKTLEIGRALLTSTADGCIENYYIPRTFNRQVAIEKDILEKISSDLVPTTEQEFSKFCNENQDKNVHLLMEDKSGRLIWHKSQGSLSALCKFTDTQNTLPYSSENLDKFLQQAQCQKVMLIADTAGMGKTTVLTHLCKQIKQKFPTYWVVRIDLNDHTVALEAQTKHKIETIEFLCEKLFKLRYSFEKELFKECCKGLEETAKVVLMFDGFDEISPKYTQTVLDLLQDLKPLNQPGLDQLWVTTRPHLREVLEKNLQQLCYKLEPFCEDNQVCFLTKFWHQRSELQEENQQKLETYARALIEKLAQSTSDKVKQFTGIPLHTRMLAEAFEKEVKTYCLSQKSEPELPKQLCLVDLYRKFIEEKINIFKSRGEIAQEQLTNIIMNDISIPKNHQKLALDILLPDVMVTALKLEECDMLAHDAISMIGIVQYVGEKPHFIHHTFAEYYVADFLVKQLTKETRFLLEVLNILFKILLEADYAVIRFFLDELLVNPEKSKMIELFGKQVYKIWKVKQSYKLVKIKKEELTRENLQTAIHYAAAEGHARIIDFFFSSLNATGNSDTINKLLLHNDSRGENAWDQAAMSGHLNTLEALWVWGREVKVNLKDDLLLSKSFFGLTAWDRAATIGSKKILEALWVWGREVQVSLKDDLLLAKGMTGLTAWYLAALKGDKEILETLWVWGKEVQANLKDDLLLTKNRDELTAWHIVALNGNKEILETLWVWGKEVHANLKDDLLLSKSYFGLTAWDRAAEQCNKEILEKLWSWGREMKVNLKDDLLLSKHAGRTAWDRAAEKGKKDILENLWGWGREARVNLKYDLLLTKNRDGLTAWQLVALNGHKEILETLWDWGKEVQANLIHDLLLTKNRDELTAWHIAALNGNKEILQTLWFWGKDVQANLKDDLLLAKGRDGLTAWDKAAEQCNIEILEKLWCWGKEMKVNLKDDLLLSKHAGRTAWYRAAVKGKKDILEKLWGWGREARANLKYDLLLYKGWNTLTAWDIAALSGNLDILETLWVWGREVQANLKDELLLAKGKNGLTAWDKAAQQCNIEILEKLWSWGREMKVNLIDDLLLSKHVGRTAWDRAAEKGKKAILEKLWGWGREARANLKYDLLLTKNRDELTAWHIGALNGNKQILETLWVWGKEVQANLKDDLLLSKNRDELTAWDIAALNGNKEILGTLWLWGKEVQANLKDDLLLAKGRNGITAWDKAAEQCNKEILEKLWSWGKEMKVNLKDDLLLSKHAGRTAWDRAAEKGKKEILEKLWGWGREARANLKYDLLLYKGWNALTAWDIAALSGNLDILETLWDWGREVQVNLKDDLLLAKGYCGVTAWNRLAGHRKKAILEKQKCWAAEARVNLEDVWLPAED